MMLNNTERQQMPPLILTVDVQYKMIATKKTS